MPPNSDDSIPSGPPASTGAVADVLGMDSDAEGDSDLSDIPPSAVNDIPSNFLGDFSLIQEKCDKFSTKPPSNACDLVRFALHRLSSLYKPRQFLSCIDELRSDARECTDRVQLLEHQVAAQSARPAFALGDKTWLEESVAVYQN